MRLLHLTPKCPQPASCALHEHNQSTLSTHGYPPDFNLQDTERTHNTEYEYAKNFPEYANKYTEYERKFAKRYAKYLTVFAYHANKKLI